MFCSIYKWQISRALDSRKSLSGSVAHHIRRCPSCREFAQFSESLENKCTEDMSALLNGYNGRLNAKAISALDKHPEPKPAPKRRPALIPVLATAAVLLVVSISILWIIIPSSNKVTPLNQLSELGITKTSFENMLGKVGSPFEEEFVELKQTMKSTANFLISRIDVRIGEDTD
ncbi:MAG: hypothetical protein JSV96_14705 [Candidatus Aminicenantes bacterium]|nr:MAG: hypothetical protein JSV96_14705 [Candidatus Aminicenantes bacterium]